MTMTVDFLVAGVSTAPVSKQIEYPPGSGEFVVAAIDQLIVELTDESGIHGSQTFRFTNPADKAEASALFIPGTTVTLAITAYVAPAQEAPAPVADPAPEPAPVEEPAPEA